MEEILAKLVAIPTMTGNFEANDELLEYVASYLEERGMYVDRYNWNEYGAFVATTRLGKSPAVMFAAHSDVVPAPPNMFTIHKEGDKLYGRGVLDMKFSIAAYMHLVDQLQDNLKDYDFGIVITSDEEAGGDNGMRKIVREGWAPKVCVLPDGGYNWELERLAKGLEWYKIEIVGKTAHASRPWDGDSASIRMINLLNEILGHFDKHPSEEADTISVSILHAGHTPNQLPVTASATLDVRTVSVESHDEKDRIIKELCKKYNAGITKMFRNGMPAITDFSNPYVKQFIQVTEQVIGRPIGTKTSAGGTDARHFTGTTTACVVIAPESGFHHAANEWLSLEGFHKFYDVIARYTEAVAKPTPKPPAKLVTKTSQKSLVSM